MIHHPLFPCDPWRIRETALDFDVLAQTESIFAISNGHIGWRANLDEGEPHVVPGSYLNGVYEVRPVPYAEGGFGYPESGESLVNVADGKLMRLLVDDEPFDTRYGHVAAHERVLDFRAGTLSRSVTWESPNNKSVNVKSTRLVSFTQRAIAAVLYEVSPVEGELRIAIQSELVANEHVNVEKVASGDDPRTTEAVDVMLAPVSNSAEGNRVTLMHSTPQSKLLIAAAMDHEISAPADANVFSESTEHLGRVTVTATLKPGESVRIVKFVAYGWSAHRSDAAVRDQVHAALATAHYSGWDGLLAEQRAYLDEFWENCDVICEGDHDLQQAVRFALFHVLQSSARAEGRAIPAKGLTGPGYNGHVFWDSESFVVPMLTYTRPDAAAHALRWRHSILQSARDRAAILGFEGACFPWRTISGPECSSYWPAGTAGMHVNADIADAVTRYQDVTGDTEFEREVGLEILAETARLWLSVGYFSKPDEFRIDGVTGPDEYSSIADNNVYTNLMAAHNLRRAAESALAHPDRAAELGIEPSEIEQWRLAGNSMLIPYDHELNIHPQAENFTEHKVWDFEGTADDQYPLLLNFHYFDLYRKQVVKQADLVLAMHVRSSAFSDEQKARNFAYYEALTVRDSSLSASTQAVIAAEVGHLDLALDYTMETAALDLTDYQQNTRDGVHLAALAGTWSALVAGFGGMRQLGPRLSFKPALPKTLTRLVFVLNTRGSRLRVEVLKDLAIYELTDGPAITVMHYGQEVALSKADNRVSLELPQRHPGPAPTQPRGRAPMDQEKVRERLRQEDWGPEDGHAPKPKFRNR